VGRPWARLTGINTRLTGINTRVTGITMDIKDSKIIL
jgi:hypothetical protein